jgi:hypothetical protein
MTDTVYDMSTAETLREVPRYPRSRYERAYSFRTQWEAVQCVRSLYALGTKACWQQCDEWFDVYEANPLWTGD